MILQVCLTDSPSAGQKNALERRFGRFWFPALGDVQYPVTDESHGEDVFRDEFEDGTVHDGKVAAAWLVEVDDDFVLAELPLVGEDDGSVERFEWTPHTDWISVR